MLKKFLKEKRSNNSELPALNPVEEEEERKENMSAQHVKDVNSPLRSKIFKCNLHNSFMETQTNAKKFQTISHIESH